jgi:translocation and assembly module TamB
MTLNGPLSLQLLGLPALGAPEAAVPTSAPAASQPGAAASTPAGAAPFSERWQAQAEGRLDGRLDKPATRGGTTPAVQLAWQANFKPNEIELGQAQATAGAARAKLKGKLTRAAATAPWAWQAQGELADFDPSLWWPALAPPNPKSAHRLNAKLDTEGRWASGQAAPRGAASSTWRAALQGLSGRVALNMSPSQWAGVPVQGELKASREASGSASAEGQLEGGGNRLGFSASDNGPGNGRVEANAEMPALAALAPWWATASPDAAAAWLPRAGSLQAHAESRWAGSEPQWQGQLRASGLNHPAWHADRIEAKGQGSGLGDGALKLEVSADTLVWRVARVDALRAELGGSLKEHQLSLQATSPARPPAWAEQVLGAHTGTGSRLQLAATGRWRPATDQGSAFDAGRWEGRIGEIQGRASDGSGQPWLGARDLALAVAWDDAGQLTEASADPGRIALPGTALRWSEARYQGGAGPARWSLKAQLEAFELAPLLARVQPELGWRGDLVLGGEIQMQAGDRVDADIVFERQRGDLSVADDVRDAATPHRVLGLSDLRVALAAHDGTWHFTAGLAGSQLGEMAGVASVRTTPQARWPGPEAPLDGVFQLHVAQLGAWGAWVPPGWRLGGDLQSSASLGGRWGAPEFSGRLTGHKLEVRNALQGVQFNDGEVELSLRGDHAKIEHFEWRGGDGTLTMSGDATLGRAPEAMLQIKAHRLRLLGRLDRRIVASGQGTLQLQPDSGRLAAQLRIDEGLIDFSRGGAPTLDDDVRVVAKGDTSSTQANAQPDPGAQPPVERNFDSQLELGLDLGTALRIKGRGLDTYLRGAVRVTNPSGRLAVRGDVRAERGTYAAYAQKLEIERGNLLFVGPIDDPRLDILAVRPNLDVQVGVAVTGTALNPRVKLYSEPEMSDTDKLSWLMLGREPDGLGRADTALLQRAAMALLAGEGETPTDAFLAGIGLSDFGVRQTGEGSTQTTVVSLGKQLSRRWYVGYERGINATTGTWQLIYRIAQRFTLRAQSGEDNALDLIWSWRWQ